MTTITPGQIVLLAFFALLLLVVICNPRERA